MGIAEGHSAGTSTTPSLKVVYRPLATLLPSARNARTHSKRQVHKIAASLRQFGFVSPILIDAAGEIIAGHGRLAAAQEIGLAEVPTICLDHMSEADRRAYRIADNRLAELAGWDEEILRLEFIDLAAIDLDLPEITGFETPEIELIVDGPATAKAGRPDPLDELPAIPEGTAVTRLGDTWQMGDHAARCGDARNPADYAALMAGELAALVFTDPPYNVAVDGHVGGLGRTKHREFAMASGEMSKPQFIAFLRDVFACMADASSDGSIHFTCIDWAHLHEMLEAGHAVYDELKNILVWAKTNGGMGSLYRSQHELIPVWKKGRAPHVNNVQLGKYGRYRTNVWTYAGVNTFRRGRMEELSAHPTVKPCALVMDAIKDCSKPGSLVLDPFGGSGTTLIAAQKTRRRARLLELDPLYVDVVVRRWQALTGLEARHATTGQTFAAVAAERAGAAPTQAGEARHDA
ncbi:site-specific DNA-methyltransferase [Salinarimonas soli]|uniref:site-specific DNA-methyltransferase n=1 Tax=Salinarimonas soli TaxID=1638099 RepID=UPI0027B9E8FB|nr:DNA methyltransferase [Salinarimonas soli]